MDIHLGRLHPLLVHLPIGILLLAFLFELLSRFKGYKKVKSVVRPALGWGALAAVFSAVTGYWLASEGGYDDRLLRSHQYLGIATAFMAVLVYLHRTYAIVQEKSARRGIRLAMFFVLTILVVITGHYGGSLTHGENYLSSGMAEEKSAIKISKVNDPARAQVFEEIIQPLLEHKCYACHASQKQKGQLRLDSKEFLLKGGKHGQLWKSNSPDESELFKRVSLPVDAEHHMPPRERIQLTSLEVDVIRSWIAEGSSFDLRLDQFKDRTVMDEYISSLSGPEREEDVLNIPSPDAEVVQKLKNSGIQVLPVGMNSNFLMLRFNQKGVLTKEDGGLIRAIAPNIVEIDLSGCRWESGRLAVLGELPHLKKLFLQRSNATDSDAVAIGLFTHLTTLNVSMTGISDEAIKSWSSLKALRNIYLFQGKVTRSGVQGLHRMLPTVQIDTGNYALPFLATDTLVFRRSR